MWVLYLEYIFLIFGFVILLGVGLWVSYLILFSVNFYKFVNR